MPAIKRSKLTEGIVQEAASTNAAIATIINMISNLTRRAELERCADQAKPDRHRGGLLRQGRFPQMMRTCRGGQSVACESME